MNQSGKQYIAVAVFLAFSIYCVPVAGQSSFEAVNVVLSEWAVTPDKSTVNAGPVTFIVTNKGPADAHEFVVMKTALAPDSLLVDVDGNVEEDGPGVMLAGRAGGLAVGSAFRVTFELGPGDYVLICNIWDAAEREAHYSMGMRAALRVE